MGGRGGQKIKKSAAPSATVAQAAPAPAPAVQAKPAPKAEKPAPKAASGLGLSKAELKLIKDDIRYGEGFWNPKAKKFSDGEKVVFAYTSDAYSYVNTALRTGNATEADKAFSKALSSHLDTMKPHKGTVHRRVTLPDDFAAQIKAGGEVKFNEFLSTSKSADKFKSNSHYFLIKSKRGRVVQKLSGYPEEQEVLFDKGSRFRVTKVIGNEFHLEEI